MGNPVSYQPVYEAQQAFFASGQTRPIEFRKAMLRKLEQLIRTNESRIEEAVYKDLRKHPQEVYMTEIGAIYGEIRLMLKEMRGWMKPKKVSHPLYLFPGSSWIYPEPLGNVLVISPWNYPFLLTFRIVVNALAAGNTVLIKPSEIAPHSAALIEELVNGAFPQGYLHVVNGDGAEVVGSLLNQFHWDHVFFTGSAGVGSRIMEMAAKHLSPVSLELGGKSPCIVAADANLKVAAQRILWGKLSCAGQTCVAADYLIVEASVKDRLIEALKVELELLYGKDPKQSDSLGRIVSQKRFDTLSAYLKEGRILHGGETDAADLYIAPTIMDEIIPGAKVMQDEIFGPILPVFTYMRKEEILERIAQHPYPLALYVFSANTTFQDYIIGQVRFGGGAVNETVLQLGNSELPFGGVSYSGHGSYLGKHGFDTFTHYKSIVKRAAWFEPSFRHAPYTAGKTKLWRYLLGRK